MLSLKKIFKSSALAVGIMIGMGVSAHALSIDATLGGNDCVGTFSPVGDDGKTIGGFDNCRASATYNSTPIIAKFERNDDNSIGLTEFNNTLFPTIDGSEFSITFNGDTVSWTYTRAIDDPVITLVTVKGGLTGQTGTAFDVWWNNGDGIYSGSFTTSSTIGNISHIAFWDSSSADVCGPGDPFYNPDTGFCSGDTGKVPVPAGLPLMLTAMGIGVYMRKRSRKTA